MAPNHKLPNIPLEIILIILSNLPIKPLCRFKSVSKPWLVMINHLIETHLENKEKIIIASNTYPCSFYSINPQSPNEPVEIKSFSECWFKILGSSNGILLLRSSCSTLFFWNPFTRTHQLIPSLGTFRQAVIQGLGYDSIHNDFKVVMAINHIGDPELHPARAYVFSSLSSSWKRINDLKYNTCSGVASSGVVLNGSPHWILRCIRSNRRTDVIVYFDPSEDTFKELPAPVLGQGIHNTRLTVSGGILCGVNDNNDNSIDVWVIKGSSWSKLFVVPRWQGEFSARMLTPFCFLGEEDRLKGKVIIQLNSRALALYYLEENRFERIELPQDCERFSAISYVETLASP